jgi:hypothetical protein
MNWHYLYTFSQTCALEFPCYAYFLRKETKRGWLGALAAVVALNAFTHPLVFFGLLSAKMVLWQSILCGEVFAFGFEAWACFYFLGLRPKSAFWAATAANLVSWQLGPLLTYWLFF